MDNFLDEAGVLTGVDITPLKWQGNFTELAARFDHLPGTVVLLSGGDMDCSRYHLLGIMPWMTLEGWTENTCVTIDGRTTILQENAFKTLQTILKKFTLPDQQWPEPMTAGLMGYLSYDLKDCLEKLPKTSVNDTHLPDMLFYAPSIVVVQDKNKGTIQLMSPRRTSGQQEVKACLANFYEMIQKPMPADQGFRANTHTLQSNLNPTEYQNAVQQIIDYIRAGDVYQVNLSQRFQIPFQGSSFGLFQDLYAQNPAPFFAFIQAGNHQVVSTSPERFLLCNGTEVETRPIKGTRPRGKTNQQDQAMRKELADSKKDDSELSMIVDLLRNDLGKVCIAGSVKVVRHKRLEAYQNVYHLVSVVKGLLETDKDCIDLIKATFPGGSITGCPKVRAMEIIDALESCRRHVYCGSIGYLSFHDTMDLSIAIRTATISNGTLFFSVGGGVVLDSDPFLEYKETLHKGRTLTKVLHDNRFQKPPAMVWHNGRIKPSDTPIVTSDDEGLLYGYGFFETIRVDQGHAPLLADHLKRFKTTWQALMPGPLPDLTWPDIVMQVIEANHLENQCACVKILATCGRNATPSCDPTLIVSARPYTHRLKTIQHNGLKLGTYPDPRQTPLANHKTLNYLYYLQAGHWALKNGFHEALILNPDDTVSETNTANLLLINEKSVVRPQSAAALPGVMAQTVVHKLTSWGYHIINRAVDMADLQSAPLLLATNALMGSVPVTHIDNRSRPANNDLWIRLNDAIIPGWQNEHPENR